MKSKQVKTLPGSLVPAEQVQTPPPSFQGPTQLSSSPLLFTCYVVSNSLRPHRLQHTRLPYPLPSLSVCSNSCPLTQWYYPTISSSVAHFSSCPQPFTTSGSFQMSQFFTSGGQSIGVMASASALPMNIYGWFPSRLTGLIEFPSKGLSRVSSSTTIQKHHFFSVQPSSWSILYIHTWLMRNHSFEYMDLCRQRSLLFITPSSFVMAFLPRSRHFFISWLQSSSAVNFEPKKMKSTSFCFLPIYLPWSDGTGCHDLHVLNVLSPSSSGSLVPLHLSSSSPFSSLIHIPMFLSSFWDKPCHLHLQAVPLFLPLREHAFQCLVYTPPWCHSLEDTV